MVLGFDLADLIARTCRRFPPQMLILPLGISSLLPAWVLDLRQAITES